MVVESLAPLFYVSMDLLYHFCLIFSIFPSSSSELNSKTSSEIKFAYKNYPVSTFENIDAMLRQCADDMPSDSKSYIVRIVYGSVFTAIVQTYDDDTYRAVWAFGYMISEPKFQVKQRGDWIV